jgi:hypothetical protein
VQLFGVLTADTVKKAISDQWQSGSRYSIWHLPNGSTKSLFTPEIRELSDFIADARPAGFQPGGVAFHVASDMDYGIMRMIDAWSDGLGFEIRISRNLEELEIWLKQLAEVESKTCTG